MHWINIIKISIAIITVGVGLTCGWVQIQKNPDYWLNRFFAFFFVTASFGFFFYTLYHLILGNAMLVIPFMITSQILFQLAMSFLLLTEWTLEFSQRRVLTKKFLGIAFGLFFITSIGYAIWVPTLNMQAYEEGYVDTKTPSGWFEFVFGYRILVMLYVLMKFSLITRKATRNFKIQTRRFSYGMGIIILATLMTLLGGQFPELVGIIVELVGLLLFNLGIIFVLMGFMLHGTKREKIS